MSTALKQKWAAVKQFLRVACAGWDSVVERSPVGEPRAGQGVRFNSISCPLANESMCGMRVQWSRQCWSLWATAVQCASPLLLSLQQAGAHFSVRGRFVILISKDQPFAALFISVSLGKLFFTLSF